MRSHCIHRRYWIACGHYGGFTRHCRRCFFAKRLWAVLTRKAQGGVPNPLESKAAIISAWNGLLVHLPLGQPSAFDHTHTWTCVLLNAVNFLESMLALQDHQIQSVWTGNFGVVNVLGQHRNALAHGHRLAKLHSVWWYIRHQDASIQTYPIRVFQSFLDVFQPETSGNGSTLTHIFSGTVESTNQILKSLYDWLVV